MPLRTQPLRDEHQELLPHIASLGKAADLIGEAPVESVRKSATEAHEFLTQHLLPHAEAEERALYPVVEKAMGAPEATATMRRDHVEVGRLTHELGTLLSNLTGPTIDSAQAKQLRAVLYGLAAMVKLHFLKEEEVYLPILDRKLNDSEAHAMFEAMEAAAKEAKLKAAS